MPLRPLPCLGAVAAALLVALPASAVAKTRIVDCRGAASPQRCSGTLPLAGLESGDRLAVRLPDTDLQLTDVRPSSPAVQAAAGFQRFSMRVGGSVFVATLVVGDRVPRGGRVTFRFAVPPAMRYCGNDAFEIDGSPVRLRDLQAHGVSCARARRVAQGCVSGIGPGPGWSALEVDRTVILQRRAQRIAFELGNVNQSCAPSG